MENVTCYKFTQPLDHFSTSTNQTFEQRYCIYDYNHSYGIHNEANNDTNDTFSCNGDGYSNNPIFFYTGNESPIDEYVNNTGLIWELAPKFSALVIFAEHRFEGTSVPDYDSLSGDGCFTYLTTTQTLADYASLLSHVNPNHQRPVVTFGGSYGGMLSAWMKILYGRTVAGSIASSAPIWGLPLTMADDRMDRASYIVGQALLRNNMNVTSEYTHSNKKSSSTTEKIDQQHGGSDKVQKTELEPASHLCFQNLLTTWPLIQYYGQTKEGREFLTSKFRLCTPIRNEMDVTSLLNWAQSPWFDLAEGDYPYPSSYMYVF